MKPEYSRSEPTHALRCFTRLLLFTNELIFKMAEQESELFCLNSFIFDKKRMPLITTRIIFICHLKCQGLLFRATSFGFSHDQTKNLTFCDSAQQGATNETALNSTLEGLCLLFTGLFL